MCKEEKPIWISCTECKVAEDHIRLKGLWPNSSFAKPRISAYGVEIGVEIGAEIGAGIGTKI